MVTGKVDDGDDDRDRRVEDGRAALAMFTKSIHEISTALAANAALLDGVGRELHASRQTNAELVVSVKALVEATRANVEHSAALQQQIGALVQVIARQNGVGTQPVVPMSAFPVEPRLDPIARVAGVVVNGVASRLNGRRGPPPPGFHPGSWPPGGG